MARTPMARSPRLFRIVLESLGKKSMVAADIFIFGIIKGDFHFYIDNGSNENTQHIFMLKKIENISLLCPLAS